MRTLAIALAFGLVAAPALGQTFQVNKTTYRIVDGDTIAIGKNRLRLLGLDTPETRGGACRHIEHPKGIAARQALAKLLAPPAKVTVRRYRAQRDVWQRPLVRVYSNGRDVSALLIKAGHARPLASGEARQSWCDTGPVLKVRG